MQLANPFFSVWVTGTGTKLAVSFVTGQFTLLLNINIFIAFTSDESVILDVLQFLMKDIYQLCDLVHAIGWSNACLLTFA